MTTTKTYYEVLGLTSSCDSGAIKRAYHKLSREYHPDRCADKVMGERMIKEVNTAYAVLSDPQKRQLYDHLGHQVFTQRNAGASSRSQMDRGNEQEPELIRPIQVQVAVTLSQVYNGHHISHEIPRPTSCTACHGNGLKVKSPRLCGACHGKRVINQPGATGIAAMLGGQPCGTCQGSGINLDDLCDQCHGKRMKEESFKLEADIPPGYGHGTTFRIPNVGAPLPPTHHQNGITRGSIILIFVLNDDIEQSAEHDGLIFRDIGNCNLSCTMTLTLAEALCGFNKTITHLDGRKLSVIVVHESVMNTGSRIIRHEGLPRHDNPMLRGNLVVEFQVDYTSMPSEIKSEVYRLLTGTNLDDVDFEVPDGAEPTYLVSSSIDSLSATTEDDVQGQHASMGQTCHVQ